MTKKQIESFLIEKKGYLKKAPIKVAEAIWRLSSKHTHPKNTTELQKELALISEVQRTLRLAKTYQDTAEDMEILDIYQKILDEKNRPKRRLYFDIEVSANIVFTWRIGRDLSINPDDIIQERAIICACYKWEGEDRVHSIEWNRGDDRELVKKLAKILDSADEVVTQNGDNFDIKWLRTRCLYHGVTLSVKFNSLDTLKMARAGFKFNSNKLDYMGKFLGLGEKIKTEGELWRDITLKNDKVAMGKMVTYCKQDVALLEKVYKKLQVLSPVKKFKYKIQ